MHNERSAKISIGGIEAAYKNAIMEALFKGTKRNVESENNSKNVTVG